MLNFIRPPICVTWPAAVALGTSLCAARRGLPLDTSGTLPAAVICGRKRAAPDGRPEIYLQRIFNISPGLWTLDLLTLRKDSRENVLEPAAESARSCTPLRLRAPGPE